MVDSETFLHEFHTDSSLASPNSEKRKTINAIAAIEKERLDPTLVRNGWEDWDSTEIARSLIRLDERRERIVPLSFSPRESLKNVRSFAQSDEAFLSPEEKRRIHQERFQRYRSNLSRMHDGLSQTVIELSRMINVDPDSPLDFQMDYVKEQAETFAFDPLIISHIRSALESYQIKHKTVDEYTSSLSPDEIYKQCFGSLPQGEVAMGKGPMTILLKPYDHVDYAKAFYFNRVHPSVSLTPEEIKHANSSGGLAFSAVADKRLSGVIIMENGSLDLEPKVSDGVSVHEQLHQFNKLFSPPESVLSVRDVMSVLGNDNMSEEKVMDTLVQRYLRLRRQMMGIDKSARDEMLAYYNNNGVEALEIMNTLCQDPLYNYQKLHENEIKYLPQQLQAEVALYLARNLYDPEASPVAHTGITVSSFGNIDMDEAIDNVFGVMPGQDYFKTLSRWVDALETLEFKGYSREEIIGRMYTHPASKWYQVARTALPK